MGIHCVEPALNPVFLARGGSFRANAYTRETIFSEDIASLSSPLFRCNAGAHSAVGGRCSYFGSVPKRCSHRSSPRFNIIHAVSSSLLCLDERTRLPERLSSSCLAPLLNSSIVGLAFFFFSRDIRASSCYHCCSGALALNLHP